jgi:hypothetical protein
MVPSFHIPNTCDAGVVHCEQSLELGLRDGRAYGRGVVLIDVDGDGWTDIWRSESGSPTDFHELRSGLYRNLGTGTFEPWDVGIAEEHLDMNWAGIFGDIDNDGAPDLLLLNGGYEGERPMFLYRNDLAESGRFVEVTAEAGLSQEPAAWWSGAFADFDKDGALDVVVVARAHDDLTGTGVLHLYQNDGEGRFEEVSAQVGLPQPVGDVKNPVWIDYDRDGDLDLIIIRTIPPVWWDDTTGLFENQGEQGFARVDISVFPGDLEDEDYFAFAVAVADFDQDGWDDVYLGRFSSQDYVLRNQGDGTFESLGRASGLDAEPELNTMGLGIGDVSGNGFPDVFIGPGDPYRDAPPLVYCNAAAGVYFERCTDDFSAGVPLSRWHGVAFGDLNRDFEVDVVANLGGWATYDRVLGEDTRDWLTVFIKHDDGAGNAVRVHLVGTVSPVTPVAAQMRLDGPRPLYRTVWNAQGFQSMNDPWEVLPMGSAESATLHVHWPSGLIETFIVHAQTEALLVEGTGTPSSEERL